MLPNPYDIEYFLVVADTLNLSRAAERLGLSQPTLSESLKRLEHCLDTQVIIRSKTGVQLTHEGKSFLANARKLLADWDELKSSIHKEATELRGQYTLGCHVSVGLYSLKHFLPALLRENPKLNLKLKHDLSRNICEDIISYKVDIGLVINPVKHPDLLIIELAKDEVCLWESKQTKSNEILILDPDLIQSQKILSELSHEPFKHFGRMHTSSLEVAKSLAEAGAGYAILPTRVVCNEKTQLLKKVSSSSVFHDKLALVLRTERRKYPGMLKFIECIKSAKI